MVALLASGATALAGYGDETHEIDAPLLDEHDPEGISNGWPETGYPAAVSIGSGGFAACSGSLITKRLVLTSAHCSVAASLELLLTSGDVYFGTDTSTATAIPFEDLAVHPAFIYISDAGFTGATTTHNVAVITLAQDAPVDPVWFRTDPVDLSHVDTTLTAVGYGQTIATDPAGGQRLSSILTIDDVDEMYVFHEADPKGNEGNLCTGDWGGPMYFEDEDGGLVQWAINAFADENCARRSAGTRTDAVASFILDQVEAVHDSTDRCEIYDQYEDGVCHDDCDKVDPDCEEPEPIPERSTKTDDGCGCSSGGPGTGTALLMVALATVARRRSDLPK